MFAELASVIGVEALVCLCEARGGTNISIPASIPPDHWLARTIGREAAEALSAHFRVGSPEGRMIGVELALPRGPTGAMANARRIMATALESGASAATAAQLSGLTRRTASRMRKRWRDAGPLRPQQCPEECSRNDETKS